MKRRGLCLRPGAVIALAAFLPLPAMAQWVPQVLPPGVTLVLSVDLASPQEGAAGGYALSGGFQGRALFTTDGGTTWSAAQVPAASRALVEVDMLEGGVGFIAGAVNTPFLSHPRAAAVLHHTDSSPASSQRAAFHLRRGMDGVSAYRGMFLKTTDGGRSWLEYGDLPPETYYLYGVSFPSADVGYVTASTTPNVGEATVLKTTDGGLTWSVQAAGDSIVSLPAIRFHDTLRGYAVGYQNRSQTISGVILRTADGGAVWERSVFPDVDHFADVSIVDGSTAYAAGVGVLASPVVYRTTDGGLSWTSLQAGTGTVLLEGISFAAGSSTGIICGSGPGIGPYAARTTDGGGTWTQALLPSLPGGTLLVGALLLDPLQGYITGGDPFSQGVVLFTANGGVAAVPGQEREPGGGLLWGGYPNPFNAVTHVTFRIPERGHVRLSIHDVQGREVALLAEGLREPGSHTVAWHAAGAPSGVYFCRMAAGGRTETGKLLLLK
ncbi:MAG: T9SS type A sorting domain-containing protein [Bacteroidota bacterium]